MSLGRKKTKAGSRSERSFAHTLIGRTRSRRSSGSVSLAKIFRESTGTVGAREPLERVSFSFFLVILISRIKNRDRNSVIRATLSTRWQPVTVTHHAVLKVSLFFPLRGSCASFSVVSYFLFIAGNSGNTATMRKCQVNIFLFFFFLLSFLFIVKYVHVTRLRV